MKNLAPICLFTYNRLKETKETVKALQLNNLATKSELIIFSDGWRDNETQKKVELVRTYLKTISGFKTVTIIESEINKGLANSIIEGVTEVLNSHSSVIVLEDDLRTTPNFLDFMNQSLKYYKDTPNIQSISGYSLKINNKEVNSDVYFHNRAHSWSWGTWKEMWSEEIFDKQKIDKELTRNVLDAFKNKCGEDISEMLVNSIKGINDSWYVRWAYDHFKNKKLAVYPYFSKVENIGFSNEGTHCHGINVYITEMDNVLSKEFKFIDKINNIKVSNEFLNFFSKKYKLKFRIKLLLNSKGRKQLKEEIFRRYI